MSALSGNPPRSVDAVDKEGTDHLQPAESSKGFCISVRVGVFLDDQATWPVELFLRGFSYETLANDQINVRDRLHWLKLHRGYTPGIYDQLAAAYRRDGHTEAARRVG